MMNTKKTRNSLRVLGRNAVTKKGWNESRGSTIHAPASYRRDRVKSARHKENHHLRNAFVSENLEDFEPLYVAKRDADWLYF